ncbi:hypothetical protein ONZ51_g8420 [Trametes cubensis]|uniref:Uncharacterized protein n=1 Tax=Trametes cubensis TaxID=1111947 RepID=A0AAD7TQ95_9APHY|nr:hypothetical protein ONZ51_g8420 [Trametes cubensis]
MLDELQVDKRGLHHRLGAGLKKLNKRVYVPTAIFTPYPSDTDTETATTPVTPTQPAAGPGTGTGLTTQPTATSPAATSPALPNQPNQNTATNTATDPINPAASGTPASAASSPATSATPNTTTSVTPAATQQQTSQTKAQVTTPAQHSDTTQAAADALTQVTATVTSTRSGNADAASTIAAPSASTTGTSSGVSTGVVVGGIIAAVIGLAGIVFAVIYFVRRSRRGDDEDDANDFNAQAFRRQSTAIPDDGMSGMTRAMTYNRGGSNTPRPPTMIERKMASTPAPYNVPVVPHPYAYSQPSFSPGQIITPGPYTPTTVNSANPFFSPYGESPIGSPVSVAPYDSAYDSRGQPISRQPSTGSSTMLSRQPSSAAQFALQPAQEAEYVDLNRSSVTPFQAAQYAEISRRLNTTPPQALSAAEVAEVAEELAEQPEPAPIPRQRPVEPLELQPSISFDESQHLSVAPTPREHSLPESPFADPTLSMHEEQLQHIPDEKRESLPQPPSPTFSSKSRVPSSPPTLPEIHIQQRPFSPVSLDFPIAPSTPRPTPSPLGSSFTMPSPPPDAHFPEATTNAPAPTPREQPNPASAFSKRPDTVYTLYDEDDAYAGI